jgi:Na+/alanine symporter
LKDLLDQINGVVWGPITLWLIGLTGLYLMLGLRLMPPLKHRPMLKPRLKLMQKPKQI